MAPFVLWFMLLSRASLLLSRGTCELCPSIYRLPCSGDSAQGLLHLLRNLTRRGAESP